MPISLLQGMMLKRKESRGIARQNLPERDKGK